MKFYWLISIKFTILCWNLFCHISVLLCWFSNTVLPLCHQRHTLYKGWKNMLSVYMCVCMCDYLQVGLRLSAHSDEKRLFLEFPLSYDLLGTLDVKVLCYNCVGIGCSERKCSLQSATCYIMHCCTACAEIGNCNRKTCRNATAPTCCMRHTLSHGKNLFSSTACQEGDIISKWTVRRTEAREEALQIVFPHEAVKARHFEQLKWKEKTVCILTYNA